MFRPLPALSRPTRCEPDAVLISRRLHRTDPQYFLMAQFISSLSPCRFPLPLFLTDVHFPIFFSFKYYTKPFTLDVSIQKAYEVISFII